MTIKRLHVQRLFDGESFINERVLTIDDGKIIAIDQDIKRADVTLEGLVVPGYIDLQVNGGGGVLFNDSPSLEKLKVMMAAHRQYGTTAMTPTLITDKTDVMQQAADIIAQAINSTSAGKKIPGIVGIHFEGPHISEVKKGTHCTDFIRPISDAEWQVYSRQDIGQVIVTLAPENVSCSDVQRMVSLGIKVCLGHTNADFSTAQAYLDAGATGITHLFNAMSPLQGREPGVVGAALLNNHISCGLIVDGFHVDYASCQLAIKTKPQGKVFLVTDAMPPVGSKQTQFALYDRIVTVDNGKLTSSTGELAGSSLNMAQSVKNTHEALGIELGEAIRMATLYPAEYLYKNQSLVRGILAVGKQADMVVLRDDLSVKEVWIAGEKS